MDDYFDALDTMLNTITLLSIIIAEILDQGSKLTTKWSHMQLDF